MRFYIIFYTNVMSGHVMSGLTLLCADLRFGLPRASPPLQSPFHSSFSLLLDFLLPPLRFKVQSSAISRSFWTSSCLPSASRSNPPLFLAPFGLPPASPPLQSPILRYFSLFLDFLASPPLQGPILRYFSLLLDFLVPPLHLKVQSSALSHSFWTSSCLPSTSKSILPLLLAPFGLPHISPPLQSPIRSSSSLLHAKKADCKAIRQSQSASLNQPVQSSISQFHQVKHLQ